MDKQTILRVFPPDSVVIETHLSYVVLAGQYAWKFKKAVKYPFVDQSTLELRRALCEKEISLNKRYAPTIYIGVVCLKRNGELSVDLPENQEEVLDFAVHMNRFDLEGDKALAQGLLTRPIVARFASDIASIHNSITPCVDSVGTEQKDQLDNVEFLECNAPPNADVAKLRKWIEQEGERVAQLIEKRRREGRVKECHGDLHLTNTVLLEGKLIAFDCLEFSLGLRMIDVCCDVAFFVMDMDFRKQKGLGAAFLSAYLERSGDYEALGLLRYFLVYRTLVRAKIHCISRNYDRMAEHVKLAMMYTDDRASKCVLMAGVSGSGKSFVGDILVCALAAVRVRSDTERKRLNGLGPLDASKDKVPDMYSEEMSLRVLHRIQDIIDFALANGHNMIVDSTSLKQSWREQVQRVALKSGAKFILLECRANQDVLLKRVRERKQLGLDVSEADEEVLLNQLKHLEPISEDHLVLDTSTNLTEEQVFEFAKQM